MKQKLYFSVMTVVFIAVAVLHLLRLAFKWEAVIGGRVVPLWVSLAGFLVALYLAWESSRRIRA